MYRSEKVVLGCVKKVVKRYYLDDSRNVYLTLREAECAHFTELGMTMVAIADELGLSARTVEYYIANVKRKLNVSSKEELKAALKQCGFRFR